MRVKDYLKLRLYGHVKVGSIKKDGWIGYIDTYLFKCPIHGLVIDRVHGAKRLECPYCKIPQIEHL